jgi:hypothetical protein
MSDEDLGQDATLFEGGIPIWLDLEFEVDVDGMFNVLIYITVDEFEEKVIRKPLYEVIEYMLDDETDYRGLYAVANEMVKESEKLREKAQRIEDSTANVSDLFDSAYDPT